MNNGDIILFTGHSGIKVEKCLERLIRTSDKLKNIEIISIDKRMVPIAIKKRIAPKDASFADLLGIPTDDLEELWDDAFDSIISEMKEIQKPIFLTFHATYFHHGKRGFFIPINFSKLEELLGKARMLFVFVNDVYRVYQRLMNKGEMFAHILSDILEKRSLGRDILIESIHNINLLLNWREIEIAVSGKIARFLKIPMYYTPVRFPAFMILRLIENDLDKLKLFYLCHPIRLVRKTREVYSGLVGEVNMFTRELVNNPNCILFYPTAIDELRVNEEKGGYLPSSLLPRWATPFNENRLIEPFFPTLVEHPLNPSNEDFSKLSDEVKSAISVSLRTLVQAIEKQIALKDYTLIEKSKDGLIVYRPDFDSEDIPAEINYNIQLWEKEKKKQGTSSRKIYVLYSKSDLADWRMNKIISELSKAFKNSNFQKLRETFLSERMSQVTISDEDKKYIMESIKPCIKEAVPPIPSKEGVLRPEAMTQIIREREKRIMEIIEGIETPLIFKSLFRAEEMKMNVVWKAIEETSHSRFIEQILSESILSESK